MSEEITQLVLEYLVAAKSKAKTRRWHEYEKDEPLPDISKIFKNRLILDSQAEQDNSPWYTVTRKKKNY